MLDTERIVFENWCEVVPKYGYDYNEEIFKKTIGIRRVEEQQILKDLYGDDFPYMDIVEDCHVLFLKKTESSVPTKKGIFELLDFLKEHKIKIAVATSTRRNSAERCLGLAGLLPYFDTIICGEDVTKGKPDPEIFLKAAKKLGIAPDFCAVLEDSINGINAALNAGMSAIMIPDFLEPDDSLRNKLTLLCSDLTETIPFLESNIALL